MLRIRQFLRRFERNFSFFHSAYETQRGFVEFDKFFLNLGVRIRQTKKIRAQFFLLRQIRFCQSALPKSKI